MSTELVDKDVQCNDCKIPFIFTAGEQEFYFDKGLTPPKRCADCRAKKKAQRESGGNNKGDRSNNRSW